MNSIADRLFGIIIDEKSCKKREFTNKIVSRYKIIGLKGFKVNNLTSFTNRYLFVVEYKDGRYYSYYINNNKDCFIIPHIKSRNVLLVYNKNDKLVYSFNGSIFYMEYIGSSIGGLPLSTIKVKIDIKSEAIELVLDEDKAPNSYFFHLTPRNNYRTRSLYDSDLHYLFEDCGDGLSKYGFIYKVAGVSSDTVIVPSDCKYLIVYSSFIDTLVLNDSLEHIAFDVHLGRNLKTLYISKDASKSLIGQFMCHLIHARDYKVSNSFFCSMEELWSNSDYIGMWDLCNEERSKNSVKKLLDGINVVVY